MKPLLLTSVVLLGACGPSPSSEEIKEQESHACDPQLVTTAPDGVQLWVVGWRCPVIHGTNVVRGLEP